MARKTQYNHQFGRGAVVYLDKSNIGAGNEVDIFLPNGALLEQADFVTVTAFNSATTATATITDGTTVFVNGVDIKSIGKETSANAPKYYPNGGKLTISLAETGATASAGEAIVKVAYTIVNAGDMVFEG